MKETPEQLLSDAAEYYRKGNIPQAELYCRYFIQKFGDHPNAYILLGMISLNINANDFAVDYFNRAIALNPNHETARKYLAQAKRLPSHQPTGKDRFLLIKAWGYGFWSDVDHVIGQLLLAEITHRTPVVHWGDNSLFRAESTNEAFSQYFEPVSEHGIASLSGNNYSIFPSKWSEQNLYDNDVSKWSGPFSRLAGLLLLNRNENILVSDFHTSVKELIPWIKEDQNLYGQDIEHIYRYLFKKYIHLRPHIQKEIDQNWTENMNGREILAVHARGSDKEIEIPDLNALSNTYHLEISHRLQHYPDTQIFLLTDSSKLMDTYIEKYGQSRIISTDCTRTASTTGLHYQEPSNPEILAREVIVDTYLATRCAAFIGNGYSNVSQTILHIKIWEPGQTHICGKNMLHETNFYLHDW